MGRKKKKGGGAGGGGGHDTAGGLRWLLTYADMITLLLGVFIILANIPTKSEEAVSEIGESFEHFFTFLKGGRVGNPVVPGKGGENILPKRSGLVAKANPPTPMAIVKKKFIQSFPTQAGTKRMTIIETKQGLTVRFNDMLFFEPNKSDINHESYPLLDQLALLIEEIPNDIKIEGHTDKIPISNIQFSSNWELSVSRAVSVVHYIIYHAKNKAHFPEYKIKRLECRLAASGYGEFHPIDRRNPKAEINRRIDVVILQPKTEDKDLVEKPEPTISEEIEEKFGIVTE
ncbi:OmpA family protein [bacterium]|nr:OmpA family protein [bacterium]MBU1753933.1 OmpA family protein [bacterium]